MKILRYFFCCLIVSISPGFCGETITLNGQTIRNCDLVELSQDGPIYQSGDSSDYHTVPWNQLSPLQVDKIRKEHNGALLNVICEGRYIRGTVFHANKDGVVVQVTLSDDNKYKEVGVNGFHQGATVIKGGIVLISDLPIDVPRSAGDPIEVVAFFKSRGMFDMGIAAKEIELLTVGKPEWFQFSDWTNIDDQAMKAKLLGIKGDKVLFLKEDGKRFVYSFAQLNPASQEKAKKVQARLSKFPVP